MKFLFQRKKSTTLISSSWRQIALILGAFGTFALLFRPLHWLLGPIAGAFVALPVLLASWILGLWGGLLAGLLSIPVVTLLFNMVGYPGWDAIFSRGYWPGYLITTLMGAVVGQMSDLYRRLKFETTNHRLVESERERSEKRYQDLFNHVPIGVYRTTPEGEIVEANPALIEILGFSSKDALLGRCAKIRSHF